VLEVREDRRDRFTTDDVDASAVSCWRSICRRGGLSDRRDETDQHGNAQAPMRVHDLRHSWCTWAVNVWPVTKVQLHAGHRDIQTTMRHVHHQTKAEGADLGGAYSTGYSRSRQSSKSAARRAARGERSRR
jgi:integrase